MLNNFELPEYLSIDLSISRTWELGRSTLTLFADITNILNRDNLAGIDFDLDEEDGVFFFTPDEETLMSCEKRLEKTRSAPSGKGSLTNDCDDQSTYCTGRSWPFSVCHFGEISDDSMTALGVSGRSILASNKCYRVSALRTGPGLVDTSK